MENTKVQKTENKQIKISDFFNTDYVDYSSYDNLRKIASVMDGQKNASRKVLYTTLDQNVKSDIKVSQFSSKVSEHMEYLHGSLDGVIVGLAQNYPGSNNINLLMPEGNFGTRFDSEASAARYIFTYGTDIFFDLFSKDDVPVLEHQYFEGSKIEPMFFVPNLPILLINGSNGVSSGFAQLILPRNPKDVQKYILEYLKNGKSTQSLNPWYRGFNGTITQGATDKQWEIRGKVERVSPNRVKITEIPIGIGLIDYLKVLDKLEEDKVIQSYKDMSENNTFLFEVRIASKDLKEMTDDQLMDKLKLIKRVSENFTVMSEENKILVMDSPQEIINHYIKVKLKYLDKRKNYKLQELLDSISLEESRFAFVSSIVNNELKIQKRKKADIEKDLEKIDKIIKRDGNFDYLLNMSIHSLTEERLKRLSDLIKNLKKEHTDLNKKSLQEIWTDDISNLKI